MEPPVVSSSCDVDAMIGYYEHLARTYGWHRVNITTENRVHRQRYRRPLASGDYEVLDCWPTTRTIASYLYHPRQKRTQLFRKQCDKEEAKRIFQNPRTHTGKGYHTKQEAPGNNSKNSKRDRDEEENEDEDQRNPRTKRRRLACPNGQKCRDWECAYSHPPRCFFAAHCWFQPNCWFDHTHGLCRYGPECAREDCWFSHRHPDLYY